MKKLAAIIIAIGTLVSAVGCSGAGGTPVLPETILPPYTDTEGDTIYPLGNKATLKDWEIEFRSFTPTTSFNASNNKYYQSAEGQMFLFTNLMVTNNSDTDQVFLPKVMAISGIEVMLIPVDFADEGYYAPGDYLYYAHNAQGTTVEAGQSKEISFIFEVDNAAAESDTKWQLAIMYTDKMNEAENDYVIFEFE